MLQQLNYPAIFIIMILAFALIFGFSHLHDRYKEAEIEKILALHPQLIHWDLNKIDGRFVVGILPEDGVDFPVLWQALQDNLVRLCGNRFKIEVRNQDDQLLKEAIKLMQLPLMEAKERNNFVAMDRELATIAFELGIQHLLQVDDCNLYLEVRCLDVVHRLVIHRDNNKDQEGGFGL